MYNYAKLLVIQVRKSYITYIVVDSDGIIVDSDITLM